MPRINLPVEEFTTPDPVSAQEETNIYDLSDLMKKYQVRHLPILRGKKVVGILSDRDIRVVSGLTSNQKMLVQARDIMVAHPVTVNTQESLDSVAYKMSKNKIGSVIVNDENDEFFGIFTATDALNALIEIIRDDTRLELRS